MTDARCDFETRSAADLRKVGAHVYFEHPSTEVICMSWAIGDGPVRIWGPGDPNPDEFLEHIMLGGTIRAFNCNFERLCFNHIMGPRYDWPVPELRQWRDTMAKARAMALPGALQNVAPALGIPEEKDAVGSRLMLQLSKPRKVADDGTITWWTDEQKISRLKEYCRIDTEVERAVDKRLIELSPFEQEFWWLDATINDRGLCVDQELCHAAKRVVRDATARLDRRMAEVSDYAVTRCSNRNQVIAFIRSRGIDTESIAKDEIEEILIRDDIDPAAREVLELRREAAKTSVAKVDSLLNGMSLNGRAKGLLMYHAAATGRYGGRRFQPQNLVKPVNSDIDTVIDVVMTGDAEYVEMMFGAPLTAVSDCIRGMVRAAPGHKIMAADYNAIEARVLAWMAGQADLVRLFSTGGKVYETMAARVYGVQVDEITKKDPRRNLGKTAVLGCGYGMGALKFQATCYKQGIKIDEDLAQRTIDVYRDANSHIKSFWYALETAAIAAVEDRGSIQSAGHVRFKVAGTFLWCRLPSGRKLCFPYPQIVMRDTPWGEQKPSLQFMGVDSYTNKWCEQTTYGGSLCNNVVQGTARDILVWSIPRLEKYGYPVVGSVHDEIVCEPPIGHGSVEEMEAIMCDLPEWARGLPVAAEGFQGERYRK